MESTEAELTICLGSSCFARGNKKAVTIIQEYLKQNDLEDAVRFRGNHCFGKCNRGPVLKINDRIFEGVTFENLRELLDAELGRLKKVKI